MGIPDPWITQASFFVSEAARHARHGGSTRASHGRYRTTRQFEHGMTVSDQLAHVVTVIRSVLAKELAKFDVVVPGLAPSGEEDGVKEDLGGDEAPGRLRSS